MSNKVLSFQEMILTLQSYWASKGCVVLQPYDTQVGAGTFHTATTLRALDPGIWNACYVQPSRRPTDGRYGKNPNRLQHYYQFQVIMKPSPQNSQELYLGSLQALGIDYKQHDIRFVEDDWESPTLGAWGLGWEVWLNGMEVTQFTYFQQVGGLECDPVALEITYGLERLAMYIQGVDSVYDLVWNQTDDGENIHVMTYGDVFLKNEEQSSTYNFEVADVDMMLDVFNRNEAECHRALERGLTIPAYECVLACSHSFNMLDARGAISAQERMAYILRVRTLAKACCESYVHEFDGQEPPVLPELKPFDMSVFAPSETLTLTHEDTRDLLFEIGCEELPAHDIYRALDQIKKELPQALKEAGLSFESVTVKASPRRLACHVVGLAGATKAVQKTMRGPAYSLAFDDEGNPTPAAMGFARGKGVEVSDLVVRDENGIDYVFAEINEAAEQTATLLTGILEGLIKSIAWPRSQRWGVFKQTFARPIRWIVALFGDTLIPVSFADVISGRISYGNRLLAPGAFELIDASWDAYEAACREHFVMVDEAERKAEILKAINDYEQSSNLKAKVPHKTLAEVVNLVEWPTVFVGHFDEAFLQIPQEIITDAMLEHQRYFPLYDQAGELTHGFILVSNGNPENEATIVDGNERVVRARLADARFFFEEDCKQPLESYTAQLERVVFQQDLGSVADKTKRIHSLVERMTGDLDLVGSSRTDAIRAAELCKCDLVTQAVVEFTGLQGVMGRYYALASGEHAAVAQAIEEHYKPRSQKDSLPSTVEATLVALGDKIDTISGIFALGQAPTGSSDPYAIRRQTLGVIKMMQALFDQGYTGVSLSEVIIAALEQYRSVVSFDFDAVLEEIKAFFVQRMAVIARDEGYEHDLIEALVGLKTVEPQEFFARMEALRQARVQDPALYEALAGAYTRAYNLLAKSDAAIVEVDTNLFADPAEASLFEATQTANHQVETALAEHSYASALEALSALKQPIDRFFEDVLVLDKDERLAQNRLALLRTFVEVFAHVADIGKLTKVK